LADTRVSDRSTERPASHTVRVQPGAGIRGRVHATRRPGPPEWRVPLLCALLVAAFALLAYTVSVTQDEDGLEEFYATPEQIQPGEPGQLIKVQTLEPGDIVSTGTPSGVGSVREPRVWLRPGDEIVISSPTLGELLTSIG